MPYKEADGLQREVTLDQRERERDRAPAKMGILTPLGEKMC